MNEIAEKIKARRLELGLTLEDVANVVGVGKSTVRKWETGMIRNMRRDKIASLASVLQMDPVEFVPAINKRLSVEDEELHILWGGASRQAKRAAIAMLREFQKDDVR